MNVFLSPPTFFQTFRFDPLFCEKILINNPEGHKKEPLQTRQWQVSRLYAREMIHEDDSHCLVFVSCPCMPAYNRLGDDKKSRVRSSRNLDWGARVQTKLGITHCLGCVQIWLFIRACQRLASLQHQNVRNAQCLQRISIFALHQASTSDSETRHWVERMVGGRT